MRSYKIEKINVPSVNRTIWFNIPSVKTIFSI